jgi:CBS domain-containing protein
VEIASFLESYAPFDAMERDALDELAGRVKTEQFPAGTVMLQQSGEPSQFLYVMRHGSAEILDDGHLVDLLGEGEVFGAWSLLGGFGPTATVRAHEDATCFLIEADDAKEILGTSQGMTFVVSSLKRGLIDISRGRDSGAADRYRRVGSLVRRSAVTCEAGTTVADAAELMAREHLSSLLIPRDDGLGIFTDRDLRTRIVAERRSLETPVGEVMTFPASAASQDAMAGEVLLLMLDEGFHHAPIVDASGKPIGVVTDTDLLGLGKHTPFALKYSIERAADRDSAVQAARELPDVVCSLVDVGMDPVDVGHIVGFTIDALTRRLIGLSIEHYGNPPVPWAWLALGSAGRQEQALHTDQDHALAYDLQGRTREEVDPYFAEFAEFVTAGLEDAGIPRCNGDAMAANSALRKSVEGWTDAYRGWMTDPGVEGSVLLSIVFDYRRVMGPLDAEGPLDELLRSCKLFPNFLRHLSRRALEEKPPTGFFKDLVVESKGQQAGRLDIKHKGITIVGNLARAASIRAGLTEKRTIGRLEAAAGVGAIDEQTRAELEEAFRFLWGVRLKHHVARVRAGESPDDFVSPTELGPVTRQALKEAFKVIARAQKSLESELSFQMR